MLAVRQSEINAADAAAELAASWIEAVAKSQDRRAFGALYNQYAPKIKRYMLRKGADDATADDLAQEVFIKAYFALPRFELRSEFGTWLYRIAINHVRDFLRKTSRMRGLSIDEIKESSIPQEDETMKREKEQTEEQRKKVVQRAIQVLPEKHQVILTLRDIQGLSYEEITQILGISPGTVDSRLHRARKLLRKKLAPFLSQKGDNYELQEG